MVQLLRLCVEFDCRDYPLSSHVEIACCVQALRFPVEIISGIQLLRISVEITCWDGSSEDHLSRPTVEFNSADHMLSSTAEMMC